jgi:15-cis-phytoene synthase/lycopene beta-cyclase
LPFATRRDYAKIAFLLIVAVSATTPWDSYLIKTDVRLPVLNASTKIRRSMQVWSYPPEAVIGTFYRIPFEEYFFFIVQTYMTSVLYLLLSKPVFHPAYLRSDRSKRADHAGIAGVTFLVSAFAVAVSMIREGGQFTYMGLILAWATPVLLLLW